MRKERHQLWGLYLIYYLICATVNLEKLLHSYIAFCFHHYSMTLEYEIHLVSKPSHLI